MNPSHAQTRAAVAGPTSTALRLSGRDALAVLHRISTQFLSDLGAGEQRFTLFCDFRGRLLHRALVSRLADQSIWLLRDDAPGAELAAFVDAHVFREEVRIEDLSDRRHEFGFPAAATDERARIEAGRPRHGHEIREEFTPFEVGLAREVHLNKGCFTGQEALMRLVTYDSVRRRLARVSGAGSTPSTPAPLRLAGDRAGVVTSALAVEDGWIGLAPLTSAAGAPGATPALEDGSPITAVFPFPIERPLGLP